MSALNFPDDQNPQIGDTYLGDNGVLYTYDGVKWVGQVSQVSGPSGPQGVSGPSGVGGPSGPSGADSQVSGPSGPSGPPNGPSGPSGPTGVGVEGPTGPSGPSGADSQVSGPSGPSGPPNGPQGPSGPSGPPGSGLKIVGTVFTAGQLPISYTGDVGDGYLVTSTNEVWVWSGSGWNNIGQVTGGPSGPSGASGPSGPGANISSGVNGSFLEYQTSTLVPNDHLRWDDFTLKIGTTSTSNFTNIYYTNNIQSFVPLRGITLAQHYTNPNVNDFTFYRTRGNSDNPTRTFRDDDIADVSFKTWNGTETHEIANFNVQVHENDGYYGTGRYRFWLNSKSGSITATNEVVRIESTGTLFVNNIKSLTTGTDLTVLSHLVPFSDSIYDLGSSSTQWRSLYVSSSTIFVGGTPITVVNNELQVNGTPVLGASGPSGPDGPSGAQGIPGQSVQITGSTATSTLLEYPYGGNDGDGFIVQDTGNLWVYASGTWTNVGQIVGPSGPSGATGNTGPSGPSGADSTIAGPSGVSGPSGPLGPSGVSGPSGPLGPSGVSGPSGISGPSGPSGISGPSGPSGADGSPGLNGPSGPSGPSGLNGTPGLNGATGPSGPSGPDGGLGAEGPSGPSGPEGPSGANGDIGPSGTAGPSGPSGPDGSPGPAGVEGPSGVSGPSGPSGIDSTIPGPTGPSGPSGDIGPSGPIGPATSFSFQSASSSTTSINSGTTATLEFAIGQAYILTSISADNAAWVRVYTSNAARSADLYRDINVDPGLTAGVIAEAITTASATVSFAPAPFGYNDDSPSKTNVAYVHVTNEGTGAATINVTLSYITLIA